MMPDKWKDTLGNIKDNFDVKEEGKSHLDDEGGVDIEFIEFIGPLGKMRLEFITKPIIIDKKTIYSARIGSETTVNYSYSKDEKSHTLMVYKWNEDDNDWIEIDSSMFDN